MGIVRVRKRENPYVQIDKTGLNDDRLSFKAKGMLAYLLSKPDNWNVSRNQLAKVGADGISSVRSGLKELRDYGYLEKRPVKDGKGRIVEWESIIYEVPCVEPEDEKEEQDNEDDESQMEENRPCGKQAGGKPTRLKTNPVENRTLINNVFNKELYLIKNNSNNGDDNYWELFNRLKDPYKDMLSVAMINSGHLDIIVKLMQKHNLELDLVLHGMQKTKRAKNPTMFYLEDKLNRWIEEGVTSISDLNKNKAKATDPADKSPSGRKKTNYSSSDVSDRLKELYG